jgi:hypothetical protein
LRSKFMAFSSFHAFSKFLSAIHFDRPHCHLKIVLPRHVLHLLILFWYSKTTIMYSFLHLIQYQARLILLHLNPIHLSVLDLVQESLHFSILNNFGLQLQEILPVLENLYHLNVKYLLHSLIIYNMIMSQ